MSLSPLPRRREMRGLTIDEGYKHLLALPGEEDLKDLEASGISDQAKIALLVESRGDLISAERDLREIELLKERGVEGSGDLERELPRPALIRGRALLLRPRAAGPPPGAQRADTPCRDEADGAVGRAEGGHGAPEAISRFRTSLPGSCLRRGGYASRNDS